LKECFKLEKGYDRRHMIAQAREGFRYIHGLDKSPCFELHEKGLKKRCQVRNKTWAVVDSKNISFYHLGTSGCAISKLE
jgi:hypothetical protein